MPENNESQENARESVERRARAIRRELRESIWEPSPRGAIASEIALVLAEINAVRRLHEEVRRDRVDSECRVRTELLQPHEEGEAFRLQGQLRAIEAEKRKLTLKKEEELRPLRARLLSLLNKYSHLAVEDES